MKGKFRHCFNKIFLFVYRNTQNKYDRYSVQPLMHREKQQRHNMESWSKKK